MVTKIKVFPGRGIQIREKGIFNLDRLYQEMKKWFDENKYIFNEKDHVHKNLDKGSEIIITWEGNREVTDYIKYHIDVAFLFKEINPVSKGLDNGFAKITFKANLVLDYHNKFGKTTFSNFLSKVYNRHLFKKEVDKHSGRLYSETLDLHDLTKKILDFHR